MYYLPRKGAIRIIFNSKNMYNIFCENENKTSPFNSMPFFPRTGCHNFLPFLFFLLAEESFFLPPGYVTEKSRIPKFGRGQKKRKHSSLFLHFLSSLLSFPFFLFSFFFISPNFRDGSSSELSSVEALKRITQKLRGEYFNIFPHLKKRRAS